MSQNQSGNIVRKTRPVIDGFEDGGKEHEPRNVGSLYNLEKEKKIQNKTDSPPELSCF